MDDTTKTQPGGKAAGADTRKAEIIENTDVLPKDVAAKYDINDIPKAGKYDFHSFGEIDLRKISLKKADALVAQGFPWLIAI